ncbi:MAG: NAD(P)/FAD-dependent oxidoreductase, partial [Rhodanobacter sp.]
GLREEGSLVLAYDADDRLATDRMREFHISLGLQARELTIGECRQLEPWISPEIAGGTLVSGDLSVDNRALVTALIKANESSGVLLDRRQVSAIQRKTDNSPVTGIGYEDGTRATADVVVLAAGTWSPLIQGLPTEAIPPVHPRKGQVLRLRATAQQPQPLT